MYISVICLGSELVERNCSSGWHLVENTYKNNIQAKNVAAKCDNKYSQVGVDYLQREFLFFFKKMKPCA